MFKRILYTLMVVVLGISFLGGCEKKELKQVVVTVDGEEVTLSETLLYLEKAKKEFEMLGGKDIWDTSFEGRTAQEVAKERAIESVIQVRILKQKAKELGIELTQEEIDSVPQQVDSIINVLGKETIDKLNITNEMIEDMIKQSMLSSKIFDKVAFTPDDKKIDEEIGTIIDEINKRDPKDILKKAKVQKITLYTHKKTDEKWEPLSEEEQNEVKAKAEEAFKKVKETEDFNALVKTYSQDEETKEKNGEATIGETFQSDAKLVEEVFKLQPNEISDLIKTEYGYEIVKLNEIVLPTSEEIDNYNKELEKFQEQLRENIIQQKKNEAFSKKYEEWKGNSDIKIEQKVWDNVKVEIDK